MERFKGWLAPFLVLALVFWASVSWARVVDFRAGVSNTVVQSGDKVYVVVELLNEQGQVDPFGYQEVEALKVQIASLLGNVADDTIYVGADERGVVMVPVDYNGVAPGTDLISVTVKEEVYDEDGDLVTRVIGSKRFSVEVQRPENTAKSVALTSIALPETPVEDEAGKYTEGKCENNCVVEAGRSFIINLMACEEDPYNGTCTLVNSQNSEVDVWLVPVGAGESGNTATEKKHFTGQFIGGVASITVPAGEVTEAGKYRIYVSAPSVYESPVTGEKEAIENGEYYLEISPRKAAKVVVAPINVDQTGNPWCWLNGTNEAFSVYLADEYGNIADNETDLPSSENTTTVRISYNDKNLGEVDLGQEGYVSATLTVNCAENFDDFEDSLNAHKRDSFTFTVELKTNDKGYALETSSVDVNVYEAKLDLNNDTALWSADNFLGTGSGVINNGTLANLFVNATNSTGSYNATDAITAWAGDEIVVHFEFYNGTTLLNDVTAIVSNETNGTISAGGLSLANISKAIDKICVYVEGDDLKLPKVCEDLSSSLDLRDKAKATGIKFYQLGSWRYVEGLFGHAFREVSSIELYAGDMANMTIVNGTDSDPYAVMTETVNATGANGTKYFPVFAVRLVDNAGNFVYENATVECDKGDVITDSDRVFVTYDDTTVTSDTCKVKSGVFSKEIPVTINWGAGPDHVQIDVPFEYVLTTSKLPMVLSLRTEDDKLYMEDPGNFTLFISDPSLVRVYLDANMTQEIHHGEEKIDWENGKSTLFVQTLAAPGDVTLTVQNAAGTVSGNVTLHLVSSTQDIPVVVGSISASPATVSVGTGASQTVTVIVKDTIGNPASGVEVTASSDNPSIADVSPASCETDAQGRCTFTVTGGTVPGTAHITFTAQAQSATVDVNVTEAAPCNAAPEAAMEAKALADWPFDPAASITVPADRKGMVKVVATMQVPAERQGQTATLYYYISLADGTPVTPTIESLGEVTLGETVTFNIFPEALDLSDVSGEFYIYVGFASQADFSDLLFNYYSVTLE